MSEYIKEIKLANEVLIPEIVEFLNEGHTVTLRLRGYSVDVGQVEIWETTPEGKRIRKNLEVDFVVNNPPQRMYIQSAFVLQDNEKTRKEERPLVNIPDHFRKIIILGNDFQRGWIDDEGVEIVSMEDFLLKSDIFE